MYRYYINAFIGHGGSIVIVITPLIALIVDQKRNFKRMGMSVEFVGKAQDDKEAIQSVLRGLHFSRMYTQQQEIS